MLRFNDYRYGDWFFPYQKVGKIITIWLSLGGTLTLVVSIPGYWHSLAYILVGILGNIRKKMLSFYLKGKEKQRRHPYSKMEMDFQAKNHMIHWILKNIHHFWKALFSKSLWIIIKHLGLWQDVIKSK